MGKQCKDCEHRDECMVGDVALLHEVQQLYDKSGVDPLVAWTLRGVKNLSKDRDVLFDRVKAVVFVLVGEEDLVVFKESVNGVIEFMATQHPKEVQNAIRMLMKMIYQRATEEFVESWMNNSVIMFRSLANSLDTTLPEGSIVVGKQKGTPSGATLH